MAVLASVVRIIVVHARHDVGDDIEAPGLVVKRKVVLLKGQEPSGDFWALALGHK